MKVLLLGFYFYLLSKRKFAKLAFIRLYKNIVNFSLLPRLNVLWLVWEYLYQCFFFLRNEKVRRVKEMKLYPWGKASKEVSKKDTLYVVSGERIFLNNKNLCSSLKIKPEWNHAYFYFYPNQPLTNFPALTWT